MPKVQTQIMPRAFEKMKQIPAKTKKQVKKIAVACGGGGNDGGGNKPSNILPKINTIKKPIPTELVNRINKLYNNTKSSFYNFLEKITK